RDAALARTVDDGGPAALARGHRVDDGDLALDLPLVDLPRHGIGPKLRRQLLQHGRNSSHALKLHELLTQVVEIEALPLAQLARELLSLVPVDLLLDLLDQADHI